MYLPLYRKWALIPILPLLLGLHMLHHGQKSCRRCAEGVSDCWKALSFPKGCHTISLKTILEKEHILLRVAQDQKLQKASHCIIFTALNDKFCSRLGREVQVTTSHILYTRKLIACSVQTLIQRKPSGPTCVVAPPKRWPGPVILPKVAQIPITLVLHQAKNLLPWKWANCEKIMRQKTVNQWKTNTQSGEGQPVEREDRSWGAAFLSHIRKMPAFLADSKPGTANSAQLISFLLPWLVWVIKHCGNLCHADKNISPRQIWMLLDFGIQWWRILVRSKCW